MSRGGETTVPRHYCLHISLLYAKVAMITDTNAERRQTWGSRRNTKRGLADVGLHVEQMSPNRPGGQMLGVNFSSH